VINLSEENQIFLEPSKGAILENVIINKETNEVDFDDVSITQNTRVSYQFTILTIFNRFYWK
jgi:phosphoenolpyruvate carboxykinase (ATP)